jgi:hypothetical protein
MDINSSKEIIMGISRALVNKLKRRRKNLNPNRGFRRQDKIDLKDEVLADSPKVFEYMRGIQRRHNASFGQEQIASPKKKPNELLFAATLNRKDYDDPNEDFGISLEATADVLALMGAQPGDLVTILSGELKGTQLKVEAVEGTEELRLEDQPDYDEEDEEVQVKLEVSGVKKSYL